MSNQITKTEVGENLTYTNEILKITVLGGIKTEGLDRMRATLKIELQNSSRPAVRHNLDLYNDTQLEKFIRKIAERHEIGTSVIAASLSELTEQLENHRLEKLDQQQPDVPQIPILSPEERAEAEDFLKAPNLLERTNQLIGESGVIGEETNRLLMYLIYSSRKREQPLHVVSLGASGTGKTHLQEKVGELIPEEDKIELTTLSENAFYYFGQQELKHKLILIEDLDGAENALYPLRELQSKKKIRKTVAHKNSKGETRTMHLVVEGPVSVSGCTTQEQIYEDNANRSFLIYLDESKEQDKRIMDYQRKASAGKINHEQEEQAAKLLRNAQRQLLPVKIINPYAESLELPEDIFKPRRTNTHYLQFIEAVTFYHQYQRAQKPDGNGEIYIETTLEDIQAANQLIKEILLRKSDELSGACRNYLEQIKDYLQKREHNKEKPDYSFTNREIRKALKTNESNQKRYTLALVNNYYIKRIKGSQNKGYKHEITSYQEYQQLQQHIGDVLDNTLKTLQNSPKERKRSNAVQNQNEPSKTQEIKAVTSEVHHTPEKTSEAKKINNPHLEDYYNWLKNYIEQKNQNQFTNREIAETGYRSLTIIKKNHRNLLESGHIEIQSGQQNTGYVYQLNQ